MYSNEVLQARLEAAKAYLGDKWLLKGGSKDKWFPRLRAKGWRISV